MDGTPRKIFKHPSAAVRRGLTHEHAGRPSGAQPLHRRKLTRARTRKLRYTTDREPGISRRRTGKGFAYRTPAGKRIRDNAVLVRIRALAIPPAYRDVWICMDRRGHLQATGRDARGRKQYRYHPDWRDNRDIRKYRRLLRFGECLPALRARLRNDLAREELSRDKVLAVMTKVMIATSMRVGSVEYARDNHSYGLTTLCSRHVEFRRDGRAVFHFSGKGGKVHETTLEDRRLVRSVRRCGGLRGRQLFQYEAEGVAVPVRARQFNEYLRTAMGKRFSAKDFRTWEGTLTVIACLARARLPARGGERARRRVIAEAIGVAAERLGNTPAVCRKAYVCPRVMDGWRTGELHRCVPANAPPHSMRLEKMAIHFLKLGLDKPA